MEANHRQDPLWHRAVEAAVALLVVLAIVMATCIAPTERTMGDAQRIIYIHVPVAWLGLAGLITMAGSGAMYLARRDVRWDHWSQAACEIGWLCCTLTLVTGSLWAHGVYLNVRNRQKVISGVFFRAHGALL